MSQRFKIGNHEAWYESEDLIHVVMHGDFTAEDAVDLMDRNYAMYDKTGRSFSLIDMRELATTTPAARKKIMEYNDRPTLSGTALYGGSFQTRVMSNLIINAMNLARKEQQAIKMVATEDEARKYIAERRAEVGGP